jgi:hypothetical protein
MLKALVIFQNQQTKEVGALLAVARAEARKREQSRENPPIRALQFVPELGVFVAIYEVCEKANQDTKSAREVRM